VADPIQVQVWVPGLLAKTGRTPGMAEPGWVDCGVLKYDTNPPTGDGPKLEIAVGGWVILVMVKGRRFRAAPGLVRLGPCAECEAPVRGAECRLMVGLTMDSATIAEIIEREGWVTVQEPAIGGGAMVIRMVARVREAGFDPAKHLHVVGVDVDWTVLRMAYVQLALLGVPAVLYVGNTLTMEMREDWYTPMHILGGWGPRIRAKQERSAHV